MIDYDYLKGLLFPVEHDESKLINPEDFITEELISIFSTAKVENIKRCFVKSTYRKPTGYDKYMVEIHCKTCGKHDLILLTKTDLIDHIHSNGELFSECNICKEKREEQRKTENDEYDAKKGERTQEYIKKYLTPGYDFVGQSYNDIRFLYEHGIDNSEVERHIRDMNYYDFLDTPYWKAISRSIKHAAGYKCSLCGKNGNLRTHHRDYTHHGSELYHRKDLICLCDDCHKRFHDKE